MLDHPVYASVRNSLDLWTQRRRPPWREIGGKHVPQPGVLRVVEPDERLGAGGTLCL